jgi:MFS family permease
MADSSDASTKTRNFTWLSAAYGIGLTAGPLLGGFFTNPNQYLPLTNIPLLASIFRGEDPARAFCAAAIGLTLSAILIKSRYASPKAPVTGSKAGGNALSVLRSSGPNIWFLLASTFFFCFGWSLFWELISATWVTIEHASVELVANRYAYGALWYALLSVSVTIYIVKQLSVQGVFYLGSSLLTCSMLAMYVTTTPFYLYGLIPLQQLGISLLYPASISTLSSKAPATVQGTVLGFHASASSLGFALSPLSAGIILPLSMYSPIFFGAGAIFMSLLLFMAARSYETALAWKEYSATSEVTSSRTPL